MKKDPPFETDKTIKQTISNMTLSAVRGLIPAIKLMKFSILKKKLMKFSNWFCDVCN